MICIQPLSPPLPPQMRHRINPLAYSQRRLLQTRIPPPNSPELAHLLGTFKSLPPRPTPLSTLLSFGAPLTPSSLVLSASYVLEELPRRLVQRVRSMESLPFVCP
jgi:26S proteasome regulatory subunit T1